MYDLTIVGAGPVGSHLAAKLAAAGHRILVLEKKPQAGWKGCCTGIVGAECVRRFGIEERLLLRAIHSARLHSPGGTIIDLQRAESQAFVLDRRAFDVAMAARAKECGAEYLFDADVCDIAISMRHVTLKTRGKWADLSFESRAVAVACGFSPAFLGRARLARFGDFAMGAQTDVQTTAGEVEVFFGRQIAPGFFAWLVPTTPGAGRAGLLARSKIGFHLRYFLERLIREGKISTADAHFSFGGIPLQAPRTYSDRLILVGDAGGQVKPTTGGGIYYGLLGAEAAAKTLDRALNIDDLCARSLAHYERTWRKQIGAELRTGYWARRIFERLDERRLDRIFQVIRSAGIEKKLMERPDLSFDWHGAVILSLLGDALISGLTGQRRVPKLADIDRKAKNV